MSADGGPVGNREVAWRVFAAEFEDADLQYSEADEERAPNYVVTPTGARVNRLFVVGVLTEVEQVGDDILRGRVVDPTGAFVVYAGQYQPDAKAFLQGVEPPSFVAVTGKARTFQPDDSDVVYTSVRPESINEVDADTRDRWAVQTASHTLHRVSTFADALALDEVGDALEEALLARGVEPGLAAGIPLARDHYGTTRAYLAEVRDLAVDAARVVAGEIAADEVGPLSLDPDEGDPDATLDLEYRLAEPAPTGEAAGEAPAEPTTTAEAGEAATTAGPAAETPTSTAAESTPEEDEPVDEEPEAEAASGPAVETGADDASETGAEAGSDGAGSGMYELDEEERQELEENYPTEFESGAEVGEPGEADVEPAAPPLADEAEAGADEAGEGADATEPAEGKGAEATEEPAEEPTGGEGGEPAGKTAGDESGEPEPAGEPPADLDDALMDVMAELNEGEGVARADLEAEMADRYGASPGEVGEAIESALMGGQCYESGDDVFTPI